MMADLLPHEQEALGGVPAEEALLTNNPGLGFMPGTPLFNLSLERNSRGATWKVHVGHEGVPLSVALDALDRAVNAMSARFGAIKTE